MITKADILRFVDADEGVTDGRDWSALEDFHQDIALINSRNSSAKFTRKSIAKMKSMCDDEGFEILTSKIEFYNDFQKVAKILEEIKAYTNADIDTIWTHYDNGEQFLTDLNRDIENIRYCDFEALSNVNIEFLVTSTYQELSMSNGWSKEYLKLAKRFDQLHERITKPEPLTKIAWWQKILRFNY